MPGTQNPRRQHCVIFDSPQSPQNALSFKNQSFALLAVFAVNVVQAPYNGEKCLLYGESDVDCAAQRFLCRGEGT